MKEIQDKLKSESTRKTLVSCGIIFPIFSTITYIILDLLRPDYNPLTLTISELGVVGTSTALIASIIFIIVGIMITLFALGLYLTIREEKSALIGCFLLSCDGILGYVGSGIFPVDAGVFPVTFHGLMHFIVSMVSLLVMVLAPFFIAHALKEKESIMYKFSIIIGILLFFLMGIFVSLSLFNILIGLFQRITIGLYSAWIFIIAIWALKLNKN